MTTQEQETLFPVVAAHCFLTLAGCPHVVRGTDPQEVHDRMETHYATTHRAYLDAVTGCLR